MNYFPGTHRFLLVTLVLTIGLLTGCEQAPEERLLGKWSSVQKVPEEDASERDSNDPLALMELAFFEDLTCTFRMNATVPFVGRMPTLPCEWILSGNNLLKLEISLPDGEVMVFTYITRFDGDRLRLEESNGTSTTFEHFPDSA